MSTATIPNVRGRKWVSKAKYISREERAKTAEAVSAAISEGHAPRSIEIRPASYIGPDCSALIIVSVAGRIFRTIYR